MKKQIDYSDFGKAIIIFVDLVVKKHINQYGEKNFEKRKKQFLKELKNTKVTETHFYLTLARYWSLGWEFVDRLENVSYQQFCEGLDEVINQARIWEAKVKEMEANKRTKEDV